MAEEVLHECRGGGDAAAGHQRTYLSTYVCRRSRETRSECAFDYLLVAGQLTWHTDGWMRGVACWEIKSEAKGGIATVLATAERLVAYAVSAVDREDELLVLKLNSAVLHIDDVKWLHWTSRVAARICRRHAKPGNYEGLTRAKVTRILEERMHAQLVRHAYAGVTTCLARAAAVMCDQRPLQVRLPELALDQAADLLARPDGMCAADRVCNRYLHEAVAQAHAVWNAVASMLHVARSHSVTKSLRQHRQERREEQQRLREQAGASRGIGAP